MSAVEVVQMGLGAGICCYNCKRIFKQGEKTFIYQVPIKFSNAYKKMKAGANKTIGLRVHLRCDE